MAGTSTSRRQVGRSGARSASGIALDASGPARLSGRRAKLVFATALLLAITASAAGVYITGPGVVTAAWLAVGPLLASLVLSPRITALVAGWTLVLGLGLALGQPGPAHLRVSHLGVLVLLAAFAVANSALRIAAQRRLGQVRAVARVAQSALLREVPETVATGRLASRYVSASAEARWAAICSRSFPTWSTRAGSSATPAERAFRRCAWPALR